MVRVSLQTYEHLNIRDGDGYGDHHHDNHDYLNNHSGCVSIYKHIRGGDGYGGDMGDMGDHHNDNHDHLNNYSGCASVYKPHLPWQLVNRPTQSQVSLTLKLSG